MSKTYKVDAIPFDVKVKLEIPGSFYARLQQLVVHYSSSRPNEELVQAMQNLAKKEPAKSEFEYHMQTLTILLWEIETAAKAQNCTKLEEIEINDDGSIKEPVTGS